MTSAELRDAGWTAHDIEGFTGQLDTIWTRGAGVTREVAFVVSSRHVNNHLGTCHGGALMTFADTALGFGVVDALGSTNCATAQLQFHFVAAARIGDFVVCRPEIVRRGGQLIFIRGLLTVDEKTVASADGIWKVLEQRAQA
jgi:uncharacterized protein (TIGR00369 family)